MPATTTALTTAILNDAQEWDSQASGNSGIVVTRAGPPARNALVLLSAIMKNNGAATLYFMIFDAAAVPGNGAIPVMASIPVYAGSFATLKAVDFVDKNFPIGRNYAAGIVWAASTTPDTLTIDATDSVWATVRYA